MKKVISWALLGLFFSSSLVLAEPTSVQKYVPVEESRLRVSAGFMPSLGAAVFDNSSYIGFGFNGNATYQLSGTSVFWAGLTGGGATLRWPFARATDFAFVHPTLMVRSYTGSVHPLARLGIGPGFWNTNSVFSSHLALGLDIDIAGPVSIGLEPLNVVAIWDSAIRVLWTPQINLVATF